MSPVHGGTAERILRARPSTSQVRHRVGVVTRVDAAGVFVTPEGGDPRSPLGPCLGARWLDARSCPNGPHGHALVPIPLRSRVLLATGVPNSAPWVLSWEPPPGQ